MLHNKSGKDRGNANEPFLPPGKLNHAHFNLVTLARGCLFKVSPSFNLNSQSKNSLSAYVLGLKLNKQLQLVMFERIGPICWEERIFGIVTLANLL